MAVIIEKSFFAVLKNFSNDEKGKILSFVDKFQDNPANPGLSLERVVRAKSDDVWSARVSKDLRAIAVKADDEWVLVYVDHHEEAYRWTELRTMGRHSRTGVLQIVELPKIVAKDPEPPDSASRGVFSKYDNDYLLSLGVPEEQMNNYHMPKFSIKKLVRRRVKISLNRNDSYYMSVLHDPEIASLLIGSENKAGFYIEYTVN